MMPTNIRLEPCPDCGTTTVFQTANGNLGCTGCHLYRSRLLGPVERRLYPPNQPGPLRGIGGAPVAPDTEPSEADLTDPLWGDA